MFQNPSQPDTPISGLWACKYKENICSTQSLKKLMPEPLLSCTMFQRCGCLESCSQRWGNRAEKHHLILKHCLKFYIYVRNLKHIQKINQQRSYGVFLPSPQGLILPWLSGCTVLRVLLLDAGNEEPTPLNLPC